MPDKKRKILYAASAHLFIFAFFAASASAQFAQPQPAGTGQGGEDFFAYAKFFYPFALSAAAILAVAMLVIAGVEMMIPVESRRTAAKEKIWSALGGLLLAALSYLILQTINPNLTQLKLTPPTVTIPANTNSNQGFGNNGVIGGVGTNTGGKAVGPTGNTCSPPCSPGQSCNINGQCVNSSYWCFKVETSVFGASVETPIQKWNSNSECLSNCTQSKVGGNQTPFCQISS